MLQVRPEYWSGGEGLTDRYKGFAVTMDKDRRDDDCEEIIKAIMMIKGVHNVMPLTADIGDHMARDRVKLELREKLWEVLK